MTQYFADVKTIDDLKQAYRRLCLIHHPDRGGDLATMQDINAQYDIAFVALRDKRSGADNDELPEEYRNIISALVVLPGVHVELCGAWVWVSGNTRDNKEAIKAAGCRWSKNKVMWYWRPASAATKPRRGNVTMSDIRRRYGSVSYGDSPCRIVAG